MKPYPVTDLTLITADTTKEYLNNNTATHYISFCFHFCK